MRIKVEIPLTKLKQYKIMNPNAELPVFDRNRYGTVPLGKASYTIKDDVLIADMELKNDLFSIAAIIQNDQAMLVSFSLDYLAAFMV